MSPDPVVRFVPEWLERLLEPLEALPEDPRALVPMAITHPYGTLPERLRGLAAMAEALELGQGPPPLSAAWLPACVREAFLARVGRLELARFCRHQEALTRQVLASLLRHTAAIVDRQRSVSDLAAATFEQAEAFAAEWSQMAMEMEEILAVFDTLGKATDLSQWDATRGALKSSGWAEILRLRKLLESLPELRALIARLGRAHPLDLPEEERTRQAEVHDRTLEPVMEQNLERWPLAPSETRGLTRSADLARVLAHELALRRRPGLRRLWQARFLEGALLAYELDDAHPVTRLRERARWRARVNPEPERRTQFGPILLCVDTSASMQGVPETVAKAVVLETLRLALARQRACHLYCFSGPGEVVERELRLDADGLNHMVGFVSQSFHGGTDVAEPLERALGRLTEQRWQLADLLIVSDGQFGVSRPTSSAVRQARDELGLRVQGILVGDRETTGMREVCDALHLMRDWRKLAAPGATRPSMAARYFPNAQPLQR